LKDLKRPGLKETAYKKGEKNFPEAFGKKNPKTIKQGFFCCKIKSLSNLCMHSKGANHIRLSC
jgi:hypothetical protein